MTKISDIPQCRPVQSVWHLVHLSNMNECVYVKKDNYTARKYSARFVANWSALRVFYALIHERILYSGPEWIDS